MINTLIVELESEGVFLAAKVKNTVNCFYSTFTEYLNEWA